MVPTDPIHPAPTPQRSAADQKIWTVAQDLETAFLAEMLKSTGFGEARDSFGGGAGEEQFASFLRRAQSEQIVQSGGVGLAQTIFDALKEQDHDFI